jgi:hypothetical protein
MNAHKVSVTLKEDGELLLKGLPFQAGETVSSRGNCRSDSLSAA